ncbi:hypothetical protein ABL78_1780 [Leptomonas seymouri]|uniref:Trypanosoma Tc-38 (p38) protein domain-containing protein n=1 Tax=Leptomonas seymouri TaxID=5684 RepID=A0A0N0P7T3_LEPSE|nr:hypothetical protein ABL78_1780 [Leptomonas seymouri]|eukprot:KPI89136.1 hypothetical protein ABL78_1780 [Leptomonas seymouri]
MSATRSRQQRLFTGALFPEALNAQLFAFATRHRLNSNVWVPQRAFAAALKPYNIFIVPNAALCDVSFTPSCGAGDITAAIGTDHVLVNAQHTSNQKFMEEFRDFLVSRLTTPPLLSPAANTISLYEAPSPATAELQRADPQGPSNAALHPIASRVHDLRRDGEFFSAADQLRAKAESVSAGTCSEVMQQRQSFPILQPDPLWDRLSPFQHPLALNGSLLLGTDISKQLLQWQKRQRCYSNYWRRLCSPAAKLQRFFYTGNAEYPGRYNPFFCVRYLPHNYTGRSFPMDIARLMRHRAVEYGYVSRLWLTERQGRELFGTTVRPERAHDFPTVYCSYHSAGLEAIAYYCADQFANSENLFPTRREIELASKGVWTPTMKVSAFPLLRQLQEKHRAETMPVSSDRSGMDLTMQDVNRHAEFCQLADAYKTIRLVGYDNTDKENYYLRASCLGKALQRQCILCGYPTPVFISHRTLIKFGLALKDGEEGVTQLQYPVRLPYENALTTGECWFNVAQMLEPAIGAELLERRPRHFLTRRPLNGHLAVQCCRIQIAERSRMANTTSAEISVKDPAAAAAATEWLPLSIVRISRWKLRPGAPGAQYIPCSVGSAFKFFPAGDNVMFRVEDLCLDAQIKACLRRYTPVNAGGYPYLRGLRQLLTLRAYERAYQSTVWVAFPERDVATHPQLCRRTPRPVRTGIAPLDTQRMPFAQPPYVRFRGALFVNSEELLPHDSSAERKCEDVDGEATDAAGASSCEPDAPLQCMDARTRAMVENGVGISAEMFLTKAARSNMQRLRTASAIHAEEHTFSGDPDDDGDALTAEDDFSNDEDASDFLYEDGEA